MTADQTSSRSEFGRPRSWIRRRPVQIAATLVGLAAVTGTSLAVYQYATRNPNEGIPFFAVSGGPLIIDVTLPGAIRNRDQVVVKSEVEGKTAILWIVSEGTYVEKGAKLVDLDSSQLTTQRKQQEIAVVNCDAAFVAAREGLAITQNQGASDVAKAELDLLFASMDLRKYEEGDYKQLLQQAQADLILADETYKKASQQVIWSRRLNREGFLTTAELKGDELTADKAKLDTDLAAVKIELLEKYTNQRNLEQYRSNVAQATMALDRVKRKASSDLVQAKASLAAKEGELTRQSEKLQKLKDQVAKCTVVAPVAGMVMYATTGKMSRGRRSETPLQEGRDVLEHEELIYLPGTAAMQADAKVPESSLRKIRPGLSARITVGAVPGKIYTGRVEKIGLLPDAETLMSDPDSKLYVTQVSLDEAGPELRSSMGCQVQIVVEEYKRTLSVPVQSVVRSGDRYLAYVLTPGGPRERTVEIGIDNTRDVHILSGLRDGEKVMQMPPLAGSGLPRDGDDRRPASRPASDD